MAVFSVTMKLASSVICYHSFFIQGFLQKPQTITIYVDLANVGSLHRDQIQVDYGRRSLNIVINNLNGKTYELNLPNLGGEIVPEKCKHKVGSPYCDIYFTEYI